MKKTVQTMIEEIIDSVDDGEVDHFYSVGIFIMQGGPYQCWLQYHSGKDHKMIPVNGEDYFENHTLFKALADMKRAVKKMPKVCSKCGK